MIHSLLVKCYREICAIEKSMLRSLYEPDVKDKLFCDVDLCNDNM